MLEKYLENLFSNENYDFKGTKIKFIKEDDKYFVVFLDEKIESIGRFLNYKINKKTGDNEPIILPDGDNFEFLDRFENCDFVNIPKKFRGKTVA